MRRKRPHPGAPVGNQNAVKAPHEKRRSVYIRRFLAIRFTPDEAERIDAYLTAHGLTQSEWLRQVVERDILHGET